MSGADIAWRFGFRVPDGWIDVDPGLDERQRFDAVGAAVDGLVADEPALGDQAVRMKNAAYAIVSDAATHDAMVVAVGFELVNGEVAPMAAVAHQLPGDTPVDVTRLAEALEDPHARDITGREVSVIELPAGPAVRVHAISEGGDSAGGPLPVVEGVDFFIPVPGTTDMLLLSCTTPAVSIGDLLLPAFDTMAQTVGFSPA